MGRLDDVSTRQCMATALHTCAGLRRPGLQSKTRSFAKYLLFVLSTLHWVEAPVLVPLMDGPLSSGSAVT